MDAARCACTCAHVRRAASHVLLRALAGSTLREIVQVQGSCLVVRACRVWKANNVCTGAYVFHVSMLRTY